MTCLIKVGEAWKGASGVYCAIVDLQAGEAEVDFNDDAATAQELFVAVEQAGYGARVAG